MPSDKVYNRATGKHQKRAAQSPGMRQVMKDLNRMFNTGNRVDSAVARAVEGTKRKQDKMAGIKRND